MPHFLEYSNSWERIFVNSSLKTSSTDFSTLRTEKLNIVVLVVGVSEDAGLEVVNAAVLFLFLNRSSRICCSLTVVSQPMVAACSSVIDVVSSMFASSWYPSRIHLEIFNALPSVTFSKEDRRSFCKAWRATFRRSRYRHFVANVKVDSHSSFVRFELLGLVKGLT